ncbi:hypothetical protein EYF80_049913 [Liparis tanakae]|uniref:Uncharacterized protein n=1 Tax=Liparis tanakae TaxID=230148 RepID=A0A4Z2FGP7_9TELE|nr:hypothetical protein EYF80_049913 [Liparis tanakae]
MKKSRCGDEHLAEPGPGPGALLPVAGGEGAQVGDDPGGDEHVSRQVVVGALQVVGGLGPPEGGVTQLRAPPPMSFTALSSFLAHESTCSSRRAFCSVFSSKVFWRAARRSSTSFSSARFWSSTAMMAARDSWASARPSAAEDALATMLGSKSGLVTYVWRIVCITDAWGERESVEASVRAGQERTGSAILSGFMLFISHTADITSFTAIGGFFIAFTIETSDG